MAGFAHHFHASKKGRASDAPEPRCRSGRHLQCTRCLSCKGTEAPGRRRWTDPGRAGGNRERESPAQRSGTSRRSAAEDPRDLLGRSRLHGLLGFYRSCPPAPRLPLPLKESFYEEEVRELGPPGVSRAPKMRSIRKRWTICTISLLLIFYKTKEMARTEEHQETQLIG